MGKRVLTALLGLVVVTGLLWIGRVGFGLLWAALGFLLLKEWRQGEDLSWRWAGALGLLSALLGIAPLYEGGWKVFFAALLAFLGGMVFGLEPKRDFEAVYRLAWGGLFLSVGWGALLWLFWPRYAAASVLAFLSLVWVADTAAYLVGKAVGRFRILPRVSPHKTWEGLIGSALATAAWGHWAVPWTGLSTQGLPGALLGAGVALVAFWGDAWESAWKRKVGIKDSGTLLPGHGGIWDRVDALLWVAPAWYFLLEA